MKLLLWHLGQLIKPDGYITNLKGMNIVKGKPAASILSFLPNISFEEGKFKINGLSVSEIYVEWCKTV